MLKTRPRSPLPWKRAKSGGGIICDDPLYTTSHGDLEYYGGKLVCESMDGVDLDFVLDVMSVLPRLLAVETAAAAMTKIVLGGDVGEALSALRAALDKDNPAA